MKTLIIGDVHGRTVWKRLIDYEIPDRVVFVGDYFDSFDVPGLVQMFNFQEIVKYKRDNPKKEVIMLVGNHDYHYFPEIGYNGTSGFQSTLYPAITKLVSDNRDVFQMAYMLDDVLFTHAGLSSEFMDLTFGAGNWSVDNMVDLINEQFVYKPNSFEFNGVDGYGDDTYQTPIWIRPRSLMKANKNTLRNKIVQVVGHTHRDRISDKDTGGRYYFVDTQNNAIVDYLVYEDGRFTVNRFNK